MCRPYPPFRARAHGDGRGIREADQLRDSILVECQRACGPVLCGAGPAGMAVASGLRVNGYEVAFPRSRCAKALATWARSSGVGFKTFINVSACTQVLLCESVSSGAVDTASL